MQKNRIQIQDRSIVNHNFMLVFEQLNLLENYPIWFKMAKMVYDPEAKQLTVKMPQSQFTWTLVEAVENKKVVLEYKGAFEGKGSWVVDPHGAATKIVFEVNVEIKSAFLLFVNKFISLQKMHSKMMHKVFVNLDTYISNMHRKRSV